MNKYKIQLLSVLFVSAFVCNLNSQTDVSGPFFSNEIWSQSGSPYRLVGNVQIPAGFSLTIEPGVIVEYTGQFEILVKGGLIASGSEIDSISFICNAGISQGVKLIRFVDANFINSQISFSKFLNAEKAIVIEGSSSGTLSINSSRFLNSDINIADTTPSVLLNTCKFLNANVFISHQSTNPQLTINNSAIDSSNFHSSERNTSGPSLIINTSKLDNSSFLSQDFQTEIELNNLICMNCKFSAYYGKVILNNCKILNSGFNNHNTLQACQTFFDINRCFLINTSFESSITQSANAWWSSVSIDQCIIKKDFSTILGFNEGDISNSIIIGANNISGVRLLRGNFNKVTILNNDIGVVRVEDELPYSITNSNVFNNSTYNLQNNSFENISAVNNFWGPTDVIGIRSLIYDYYDDINLGEVDISNHRITPRTDCPISPPRNLEVTETNGVSELSWSPNPEGDLAGYRLYFGLFDGFTFQNSIDIGNTTSYIIPDSIASNTIAITALDNDIININDMIEGHESWYSMVSDSTINIILKNKTTEKLDFRIYPNPTDNFLKFQFFNSKSFVEQVDIVNLNGTLVFSEKIESNNLKEIDISDLPKGLYFVKVVFDSSYSVKRIIKN